MTTKKKKTAEKKKPENKKGKLKKLTIEDIETTKAGSSEPAEKTDRACKPNCRTTTSNQ